MPITAPIGRMPRNLLAIAAWLALGPAPAQTPSATERLCRTPEACRAEADALRAQPLRGAAGSSGG